MKTLIVIAAALVSGCASKPFVGWCAVPQAGQTDSGVPIVRVLCKADE